jgi:hypothetical protein
MRTKRIIAMALTVLTIMGVGIFGTIGTNAAVYSNIQEYDPTSTGHSLTVDTTSTNWTHVQIDYQVPLKQWAGGVLDDRGTTTTADDIIAIGFNQLRVNSATSGEDFIRLDWDVEYAEDYVVDKKVIYPKGTKIDVLDGNRNTIARNGFGLAYSAASAKVTLVAESGTSGRYGSFKATLKVWGRITTYELDGTGAYVPVTRESTAAAPFDLRVSPVYYTLSSSSGYAEAIANIDAAIANTARYTDDYISVLTTIRNSAVYSYQKNLSAAEVKELVDSLVAALPNDTKKTLPTHLLKGGTYDSAGNVVGGEVFRFQKLPLLGTFGNTWFSESTVQQIWIIHDKMFVNPIEIFGWNTGFTPMDLTGKIPWDGIFGGIITLFTGLFKLIPAIAG